MQRGQKSNRAWPPGLGAMALPFRGATECRVSPSRLAQSINSGCPQGADEGRYLFPPAATPSPSQRQYHEGAGSTLLCPGSPRCLFEVLGGHLRGEPTNRRERRETSS